MNRFDRYVNSILEQAPTKQQIATSLQGAIASIGTGAQDAAIKRAAMLSSQGKNLQEKNIHDAVRPGILKRQTKGKMTCTKARALKAKQKNKGNHTAKAAQRYLNYHC